MERFPSIYSWARVRLLINHQLSLRTMPKRRTVEEFVKEAREIHGDYYDYGEVKYVYASRKIPIICPKHGRFLQSPSKHLAGQGCRQCSYERNADRCRLTKAQFVRRARQIHGDRYDYSEVIYKNNNTKVRIICPKHGPFMKTPGNHTHKTNPQGCPACAGRLGWTTNRFVDEARQIHGNKYDYRFVECTNATEPLVIICPIHGCFKQDAMHHINRKQGCPKCGGTVKKTTEQFVREATKIHGDRYDYSEVVYKNNKTKVRIICSQHGPFMQTPGNHTHKTNPQGCPRCSKNPWTKERFILEAQSVHPGKYDYGQVKWKGYKTPVTIICPYHGKFKQTPQVHLMGCGCQKCTSSKGETIVREILIKKGLRFEEQVSFSNCRDQRVLPFDFLVYHEDRKLLIEYHGAQHYEPVFWGGNSMSESDALVALELIKKHDGIKREWSKQEGIPLLIIPYSVSEEEVAKLIEEFVDRT